MFQITFRLSHRATLNSWRCYSSGKKSSTLSKTSTTSSVGQNTSVDDVIMLWINIFLWRTCRPIWTILLGLLCCILVEAYTVLEWTDLKELGVGWILPRDWNLTPIFTHKWAYIDMNWGGEGSTLLTSPPRQFQPWAYTSTINVDISISGDPFSSFKVYQNSIFYCYIWYYE